MKLNSFLPTRPIIIEAFMIHRRGYSYFLLSINHARQRGLSFVPRSRRDTHVSIHNRDCRTSNRSIFETASRRKIRKNYKKDKYREIVVGVTDGQTFVDANQHRVAPITSIIVPSRWFERTMNFLMVIVSDWSCMEQDWKFAINNRRFPSIIFPRLSSS